MPTPATPYHCATRAPRTPCSFFNRLALSKRYAWLAAIPTAAIAGLGSLLYLTVSPHLIWLYLPFFLYYVAIPLLDWVVGSDHSNPSASDIEAMEQDSYYVWINRVAVVLVWPSALFNIWFMSHFDIPWHAWPIMIFNISFGVAAGAVLGHTLAHSRNRWSRRLATITNALMFMGHLGVDHNRGHHLLVATPQDCSSAKMGQSIYAFALQDYFGGLKRSWSIEAKRLKRKGLPLIHPDNETLQAHIYGLLLLGALMAVFGWQILYFMVPSILLTGLIVGVSNYVTHYGLLRRRLDNGRLEPIQPKHSWNSNHIVSNILLLHISRHSDHHAHPGRGYQSVCSPEGIPELPASIAALILAAFIPPLWYKIMDPLLVKIAKGQANALNIYEPKRQALIAKYHMQ